MSPRTYSKSGIPQPGRVLFPSGFNFGLKVIGFNQVNNEEDQRRRARDIVQTRDDTTDVRDRVPKGDLGVAIPHRGMAEGIEKGFEGFGKTGIDQKIPDKIKTRNQEEPNLARAQGRVLFRYGLKALVDEEKNESQ